MARYKAIDGSLSACSIEDNAAPGNAATGLSRSVESGAGFWS